ncbi:MAG: TRAP transporter large permease subunit, partial [Alphaproteobacteria bacterium]
MQKPNSIGARVNGRLGALIAIPLVVLSIVAVTVLGATEIREFIQEYLSVFMFAALGLLLFSGYPVAFILGGLALLFGLIGYFLGTFSLIEFFNFVPRIWGQAAENLVLVALPTFVFMGVMMERSGVAHDMLYCSQVLLRRVPGALALAVTI